MLKNKILVGLMIASILGIFTLFGYYSGISYAISHTEVLVVDENISLLRLEDHDFWTINRH